MFPVTEEDPLFFVAARCPTAGSPAIRFGGALEKGSEWVETPAGRAAATRSNLLISASRFENVQVGQPRGTPC